MAAVINLNVYKHKAYLELCLSLIGEACDDLDKGDYDLAREQLQDILDTFSDSDESILLSSNVIPLVFPKP